MQVSVPCRQIQHDSTELEGWSLSIMFKHSWISCHIMSVGQPLRFVFLRWIPCSFHVHFCTDSQTDTGRLRLKVGRLWPHMHRIHKPLWIAGPRPAEASADSQTWKKHTDKPVLDSSKPSGACTETSQVLFVYPPLRCSAPRCSSLMARRTMSFSVEHGERAWWMGGIGPRTRAFGSGAWRLRWARTCR